MDIGIAIADREPIVLYSGVVVLLLVFSLFRWGSGRDIVVGLAVMLIGFAASVLTDNTGLTDMIGGAAVLLFAAALGAAVRYRSAAREQLIERAKLTERELLARELHDTVAHHVSAIAIQAQAGLFLVRSGSSGGSTDALEIIDREAAQTLAEMRMMVGPCVTLGNSRSWPQHMASPTWSVSQRTARTRSASTSSCMETSTICRRLLSGPLSGRAGVGDHRPTPRTAANPNRDRRQCSATEIQLTVSDNGARADPTQRSIGYGLVGMTERVSLLGGTLTAGPNPDRGWSVQATLPCNVGRYDDSGPDR